MRWLTLRSLGLALLLLGGVTVAGAGQADLPLPWGVAALPEPTRVDLGASTLNVHSFMTSMDERRLIEFYQDALPKAGWVLALLPWQASHLEATKRLEKAFTYHRDTLDEQQKQQAEERLAEFQRTRQKMQRQLYASRGQEHLIVHLWPMGTSGTAVFLNRWRGDRSAVEGGRLLNRGSPQGTWPVTNACCSGEEIPDLNQALPASFPTYPGATAVARSTPPARGSRTTLLFMVPEAVEAVSAYYEAQMPRQGWTRLAEESSPPARARGAQTRPQAYERSGTICLLTIVGVEEAQTMILVSCGPRPQGRGQSP